MSTFGVSEQSTQLDIFLNKALLNTLDRALEFDKFQS
jgi:hypothetical protein